MTHTCSCLYPAQGLQEAIAEHKPLMGKLQHITTWLAKLRPREEVPLWQRLQVAEEQYGSLQEQVQQAATTLREAIPRHSQVNQDHQPPAVVSTCAKAHGWGSDGGSLLAPEQLASDCCLQGTPPALVSPPPSFSACRKAPKG